MNDIRGRLCGSAILLATAAALGLTPAAQAAGVPAAGIEEIVVTADKQGHYYESQLAGESDPVADVHFHPVEPRTLRLALHGHF